MNSNDLPPKYKEEVEVNLVMLVMKILRICMHKMHKHKIYMLTNNLLGSQRHIYDNNVVKSCYFESIGRSRKRSHLVKFIIGILFYFCIFFLVRYLPWAFLGSCKDEVGVLWA